MVGRPISLEIARPETKRLDERLKVVDLTCVDEDGVKVLDQVSFSICGGEILGVAGIAGSGQREICEAITGLYPAKGGAILYSTEKDGVKIRENLIGMTPLEIIEKGIALAFVPEDRLGMGLVASMDMTDNVMLKSYQEGPGL